MTDWNPSNPAVQEAEDFGNVPPEEAYEKCSNCGKRCLEIFSGQCDTCFLEEQYYGGGTVMMFDPNPGDED